MRISRALLAVTLPHAAGCAAGSCLLPAAVCRALTRGPPPARAPAVIDKAVKTGCLHSNTAARRKARLAAARRNVLVAAGLYTPAQ